MLLFFVGSGLFGQVSKTGFDVSIEKLVMDQWTTDEGLISNNITSVFFSKSGELWITTFNGAMRFDGSEFELFDKVRIPQLKTNAFYSINECDEGYLLFSSQSSGIQKFQNGQFSAVGVNDQIPQSIRTVLYDSKGKMWTGSNSAGLFVVSEQGVDSVEHGAFKNVILSSIIEANDGTVYVGTEGRGVVQIKGASIKVLNENNGLNDALVNTLYLAKNGDVIVGSFQGLNAIRGDTIHTFDKLKRFEVNNVIEDDFGNYWLGTEQGLVRYNIKEDQVELFGEEHGLPASQISGLTFDNENNLWLGTKKAGLLKFSTGKFLNYSTNDGLTSARINIISQIGDQFLVGSDDGNVNVIDESGSIERLNLNQNLNGQGVRDIKVNKNGDLLIGSYNGLLQVTKEGNETLLTVEEGLGSNKVRTILIDANNDTWLGTRTNGITVLKDGGGIEILNVNTGLSSNFVLCIEEDKDGVKWIGTHSGGLDILKQDGSIENVAPIIGRAGFLIFNLTFDDLLDVVWLATNTGLHYYDAGQIKKIEFISTKPVETIFDVVLDENHNLWMSSNLGLLKIEESTLAAVVNNEASGAAVTIFDDHDGMLIAECTGATRSTLDDEGRVWVPTLQGVSVINPSAYSSNLYVPPVKVTSFQVDDSLFFMEDKLKVIPVEPGNIRFIINYTSLSYASPEKVRFKYRLKGVDKEWEFVENLRSVDYTNLGPDLYEFEVFGSNNDGVWNEEPAVLMFRVKPYFYQTIWFYFLCIGVMVFVFWLYFEFRVKKMRRVNQELLKLNEELDRFVYSASHDLRAPLTSVLGLVEIARLDPSASSKDKSIELIGKSVLKLDGFIKDIIDYSRNKRSEIEILEVDFEKLIHETYEQLKYLDTKNQIFKELDINLKTPFVSDPRRISVIFKNLIGNGIKYHRLNTKEKAFIKVKVKPYKKGVEVVVEDNGKGIQEEHVQNIFKMFYRAAEDSKGSGLGLYIVKETVDKLKGTIEVQSIYGAGTVFKIYLPCF